MGEGSEGGGGSEDAAEGEQLHAKAAKEQFDTLA